MNKKSFFLPALVVCLSIIQSATAETMTEDFLQKVVQTQLGDSCGETLPTTSAWKKCAVYQTESLQSSTRILWNAILKSDKAEERTFAKQLQTLPRAQHPYDFHAWMNGKNALDYPHVYRYAVHFRVLEQLQKSFRTQDKSQCLWTNIPELDKDCNRFCRPFAKPSSSDAYACLSEKEWSDEAPKQGLLVPGDQEAESTFSGCATRIPQDVPRPTATGWKEFGDKIDKQTEWTKSDQENLWGLLHKATQAPRISQFAAPYKVVLLLRAKSLYERWLGEPLRVTEMPAVCGGYASVFQLEPFLSTQKLASVRAEQIDANELDFMTQAAQAIAKLVKEQASSQALETNSDSRKKAQNLVSTLLGANPLLWGSFRSSKPLLRGLWLELSNPNDDRPDGWLMLKDFLKARSVSDKKALVQKALLELKKQLYFQMDRICQPNPDGAYRLQYLVADTELNEQLEPLLPAHKPLYACMAQQYKRRESTFQTIDRSMTATLFLLGLVSKSPLSVIGSEGINYLQAALTEQGRLDCNGAGAQCAQLLASALDERGTQEDSFAIMTNRLVPPGGFGGRPMHRPRSEKVKDMVSWVEMGMEFFQDAATNKKPSVLRYVIKEGAGEAQSGLVKMVQSVCSSPRTRLLHIQLPEETSSGALQHALLKIVNSPGFKQSIKKPFRVINLATDRKYLPADYKASVADVLRKLSREEPKIAHLFDQPPPAKAVVLLNNVDRIGREAWHEILKIILDPDSHINFIFM